MEHEQIGAVSIFGAGTMGHGIAQVVSSAGIPVRLADIKEDYLHKARAAIDGSLDRMLKKGRITSEEKDRITGRIAYHTDLKGAVGDADLVIEAVPSPEGSAVRGSTLLFDQQVRRFFSTLPGGGRASAGVA